MNEQTGTLAALEAQITQTKKDLEDALFDTESYVVRKISGVGNGLTKDAYRELATNAALSAEFAKFNQKCELTSMNRVLLDGNVMVSRATNIQDNLTLLGAGIKYSVNKDYDPSLEAELVTFEYTIVH